MTSCVSSGFDWLCCTRKRRDSTSSEFQHSQHDAARTSIGTPSVRNTIIQLPCREWLRPPSTSNTPEDRPIWTGEEIARRMHEPWKPGSAVTLVYNFDGELDDFCRLGVLLHTWKTAPDSSRPRLIMVAGEHKEDKDTLGATINACETGLGSKLTRVTDDRYLWGNDFALIRGAPLLIEKCQDEVKRNILSQRGMAAAERLEDELGDSRFILQTNTSSVLPSLLKKETMEKCSIYSNVCTIVLGLDRWIQGANIHFDPPSYHRTVALCQEAEPPVPVVHCHGSLMSFSIFSLCELPNWEDALDLPSTDVAKARDDIYFSMVQHIKWSGRILGCLKSQSGSEVASFIESKFSSSAELLWRQAWLKEAIKVDNYTQEDCTFTKASIRLHTFAKDANCPLSNTLGDFAAACYDVIPMPQHLKFIPASIEWEAGKPTLTRLTSGNIHYIATGDRQDDMIKRYQALRQRLVEQAESLKNPEPIINVKLAEDWSMFKDIASVIHREGLRTVRNDAGSNLSASERDATQKALQGALDALESGAMTTRVQAVLKSPVGPS